MECDSDNSSPDDTMQEDTDDKNLQQVHDIVHYGNLCEELKRVKQSLDENRIKLAQLESGTVEITSEDDEEIIQIKVISKHEHLCEEIKRMEREYDLYQIKLAQIENNILKVTLSQMTPTNLECLVSPMVSPTHNTQDLSEDTLEVLPHAPVPEGTLRQPEGISDTNVTLLQSSTKELKVISLKKTCLHPSALTGTLHQTEALSDQKEALFPTSTKEAKVISPNKSSIKESPDSPPMSPTHQLQDTSDVKILKDFTDSEQKYDGKGKQAANPKFRYNKRLTPEVSPIEVPSCRKRPTPEASPTLVSSKETLVKPSETTSSAPNVETIQSPSPNSGTRVSSSLKRKVVESDEKNISGFSMSSENLTDDTKIVKKLKFDDEKASKEEFPIITELLTKEKHALSESSENVEQSCNEIKELTLTSVSGQSKIIIHSSSSEESSLTSGNEEISRSETESSSLTSKSDVTTEKEESSLSSKSDVTTTEKEESSLSSESDVTTTEKEESSLTSVSDLSNDERN